MIALSLTLSLFLYQGPGPSAASSKTLPEAQTLMFLELAPLERWRQVRDRVFQIQAFEDPSMARFFQWMAVGNGDTWQLSKRSPELFSVLEAFDQGFTAAFLFDYGTRPEPKGVVLVAAASQGSKVKEAGKRFAGLFQPRAPLQPGADVAGGKQGRTPKVYRRTQRELSLTEAPIADSPVRSHYATWKKKEGGNEHDWYSWRTPHLSWTVFGRRAALFAGTSGNKDYGEIGRKHLEKLIGLDKSRGGNAIGEPLAVMEGEIALLRGGLRFRRFAQDEKTMSKNNRKEIVAMGFDGWEGVQAGLFSGPEGLREVYQILDAGNPNSFYRIFKEPRAPLKQLLSHLSPRTLAFARVGADGKALSQWIENSWSTMNGREDRHAFLRICRSLLGLPEQEDGEENFDDLENLTFFVLPAGPGAPVPQPGIMIECPETEGEVQRLLETIGTTMLKEAFGADDSKIKLGKLGKGEDAVQYLSFKKLFAGTGRGGMSQVSILTNFLGGGFFSAKRMGPYLVLGCNPKDIRRMGRSLAKGKTLLARPDIQKRFAAELQPEAKSHLLDLWMDPAPMVKSAGMLSAGIMPLLFLSLRVYGDEAESIPMAGLPRWGDASKLLHPETIQAVRIGSNIQIEHKGGTLLSPMAWWGVGLAEHYWTILSKLVR